MFSTIMTNDEATLVQRELIIPFCQKKHGNGLPYVTFYIRNKNSDSEHDRITS